MIATPLRASTVACVMALLASPAIADTVSITVYNSMGQGQSIVELRIDGTSLENWTMDRVASLGGMPNGGSGTYNIECDPSGSYDIFSVGFQGPYGPINFVSTVFTHCGSSITMSVDHNGWYR